MDTRKIRKLIELVKETGIGELEVKSGEESVRISCQQNLVAVSPTMLPPHYPTSEPASTAPAASAKVTETIAPVEEGHNVLSPMVGTVYLAPASGAMPFVRVGDSINVGETLCLIEAMKMFNKIEADVSGVISARLVENEQPVEYSQPLFIIEPAE